MPSTRTRYFPPSNFGMVEEDLYRSSVPKLVNFPFLDTLQLRTIIYLSQDEPPNNLIGFCEEQKIDYIQPKAILDSVRNHSQTKLSTLPEEAVIQSLDMMLDSRHYPVLVCCRLGRHKTGTVIGCLRKLQRWSLSSIFAEYHRFAPDTRPQNEQFIELFDSDLVTQPRTPVRWFTILIEAHREVIESKSTNKLPTATHQPPQPNPQASKPASSSLLDANPAHIDANPAHIDANSQAAAGQTKWSFHPHRPLKPVSTTNAGGNQRGGGGGSGRRSKSQSQLDSRGSPERPRSKGHSERKARDKTQRTRSFGKNMPWPSWKADTFPTTTPLAHRWSVSGGPSAINPVAIARTISRDIELRTYRERQETREAEGNVNQDGCRSD
ncbi:hypothetical protein AAMO2058_000044000 [Amorphochlora amoebiformis]